ncbi:MAG TPA: peptide chain release factor N(5)-glutamine methyltransferase [Deltaproteobacteria bacterium]|nr:peptide chain release factor N(5)-glutamine methyltransferase [Deltaproteobacteria bacterium]
MQIQSSRERQWTILSLIQWTVSYFKSHHIENPRADAEILLAHVLGVDRIDLYLRYDQPLHTGELSRFKLLIKRRIQREPIAYITGTKEFWSLDFRVTTDVLIPRPETECLVEKALVLLSGENALRVLELGTGSGAISIALGSEKPNHHYFASDRSVSAVRLAGENAKRHKLNRLISFFAGDWFRPLNADGVFDLIISNPPYIRTKEIDRLEPEIFQNEPRISLDGGADGLRCIQQILVQAHHHLKPKGRLLLEMGYDQREKIQAILNSVSDYENIAFFMDYSGHDRGVQLEKKS